MSATKERPAPPVPAFFFFFPRPQVFGDWTVPLSLTVSEKPAPRRVERAS